MKQPSSPLRVLIADDHEIVRAGLKQFLADVSDLEVSGEAASGAEARPEYAKASGM